jgi:Ca2+-binding RTX toxin-like protein
MVNAWVLKQLEFKERFSVAGTYKPFGTPEAFDAAVTKIKGSISVQAKAFGEVNDKFSSSAALAGLGQADSNKLVGLAAKALAAQQAISGLSNSAPGLLLEKLADWQVNQRFPLDFNAFLYNQVPTDSPAILADLELSFEEEYGITRANYASIRQEFISLNNQAEHWATQSNAVSKALENYSEAYVLSEILGSVNDAIDNLITAGEVVIAQSLVKAVIEVIKGEFEDATGIPTDRLGLVKSTIGFGLEELAQATGADNELLDEFQSTTGLRILFASSEGYTAGIVNDVLLVSAQGENSNASFDLSTVQTWNAITKVQLVGSNGVDEVKIVKEGLQYVGVNLGGGNDIVTVDSDLVVGNLPAKVVIYGGSGEDNITAAGSDLTIDAGADGDKISIVASPRVNASGGGGNDTFYVDYSVAGTIDGGSGNDTVDYSNPKQHLDLEGAGEYGDGVELTLKENSSEATAHFRGSIAIFGDQTLTNIENFILTPNDDIATGNEGANTFFGNGGKDELYGGAGDDTLNGGLKDNVEDNVSDWLEGGDGNDSYFVGQGDKVFDSDGKGTITFEGIVLKGPIYPKGICPDEVAPDAKPYINEDGVIGPDGERYLQKDGDVIVTLPNGHKFTVKGFFNEDFGWKFYEGDKEVVLFGKGACFKDPIVVDLDGDGVSFTSTTLSGAYFDYNSDGFAERTAWAGPKDGLLVVDLNGDGKITTSAELFAQGSVTGFTALAAYDTDHNGILNAQDAGFATLKIWQDANGNGVTDAGELKNLADVHIASIDLAGAVSGGASDVDGVVINQTSTVTFENGSTAAAASVDLEFNSHATEYLAAVDVDPSLASLPGLNGYGTVRDLDVAMTEDAVLRADVAALASMTANDASGFAAAIEELIMRWHRVGDVPEDGRGQYVDGKYVAAMEAYVGQAYNNTAVTNSNSAARGDAGAMIQSAWDIYHANVSARFMAQTTVGQQLFPELHYYGQISLELDAGTSITTVMERMAAYAPTDEFQKLAFWNSMALVLHAVKDQFIEQGSAFDLAANAVLAANGVTYGFEQLYLARVGLDGGDVIIGHGWDGLTVGLNNGTPVDDLIVSGAGDDRIIDTAGNNTLIYGEGRGSDRLELVKSESWDIKLIGLNADDVTITLSPVTKEVTITIIATGETLTVEGLVRNGQIQNHVDVIFADGTQGVLGEGSLAFPNSGTDANDVLFGTAGSDIIAGGKGDDQLNAGGGDDTYVLNPGDGHDIIKERGAGGDDTLQIGAAYKDVTVTEVIDAATGYKNLVLTLSDGTSVTILANYQNAFGAIENFQFSDGTLTHIELMALVDALKGILHSGTPGADDFGNTAQDEIFVGGGGKDTYHFGLGSGHDVIRDEIYSSPDNTLVVDASFADVGFKYDANGDVILTLVDGSSLQIHRGHFSVSATSFVFNDQTLTWDELRATAFAFDQTITGAGGDDLIVADSDFGGGKYAYNPNTITGGQGNDTLDGGYGADRYVFSAGDGQDIIIENQETAITDGDASQGDTLIINGYGASDIVVSRIEDDNDDLVLTLGANGDKITIYNQLEGNVSQSSYVDSDGITHTTAFTGTGIEQIVLGDGTVWTIDQLRAKILESAATNGSDTINGFDNGNDTIRGGQGDDTLNGLSGSDTYVYALGDGADTIIESVSGQGTDTLKLVGIDPASVIVTKDGLDIVITFLSGMGDSIRLVNQLGTFSFGDVPTRVIEKVVFDNGTALTDKDLSNLAFGQLATSGDDTIIGTSDSETLFLSGGNDVISGGPGDDTYVLPVGASGNTLIKDAGVIIDSDVLQLDGVTPDQVSVVKAGNDAVLTLPSGSITLATQFGAFGSDGTLGSNLIETIKFGNGVVWDAADIRAASLPQSGTQASLDGTLGADSLAGTSLDETIDGKGGNDTLNGGEGSDLYIFGRGSGNDRIAESGNPENMDVDRVSLTGLNPSDVEVTRISTQDIQIRILDTGETLTLGNQYGNSSYAIEFITFADGTVWDNDDLQSLAWQRGTSGDDTVNIIANNTTVLAGAGNDAIDFNFHKNITLVFDVGSGTDSVQGFGSHESIWLRGVNPANVTFELDWAHSDPNSVFVRYSANDVIRIDDQLATYANGVDSIRIGDNLILTREQIAERAIALGTLGDDVIHGSGRGESLDGRAGDDQLIGGAGNDTYIWRQGNGNDVIRETNIHGEQNGIRLEGLNAADVSFTRSGRDLIITIIATGETLTVSNQFFDYTGNFYREGHEAINQINFADGSFITADALWHTLPNDNGYIELFANNTDVSIVGTSVNDQIQANDLSNVINGGAGNDILIGGSGSDIYVWNPGSGNDNIQDSLGQAGDIDTLRIQGANSGDFILAHSPEGNNSLQLIYRPTGETIVLFDQLESYRHNIEKIVFDDGTIWEGAAFQGSFPYVGTTAADFIGAQGETTNDILQGLEGNDVLIGGFGSDTYVWTAGDGNDVIGEVYQPGGYDDGSSNLLVANDVDVLRIKGVAQSDIGFSRSVDNAADLIITIASTGEQITLSGQLSGPLNQLEKLIFDDGSELLLANIGATLPIVGTSGDDTLILGGGNDAIRGLQGQDTIVSGAGSDTVFWSLGDGNDVLVDQGFNVDQDKLILQGVGAGDLQLTRGTAPLDNVDGSPTSEDLIITIISTNESIVVKGQFATGSSAMDWNSIPGIESIVLDDGTTLSRNSINNQLGFGTTIIGGTGGDDTLTGSDGNDVLIGGSGNDSYNFDRGASEDIIVDTSGSADFVIMNGSVTPEALTLQRIGDDLLIEVAGHDRLSLRVTGQFLEGSDASIEGIRFANGLVWTALDIQEIIIKGSSTEGNDVITGFATDDIINAHGGNDLIRVGAGSDRVDGGAGFDVVELQGSAYRYSILNTSTGLIVTDNFSGDIKVLTNVEAIRFADMPNAPDVIFSENVAPVVGAVQAAGFEDRPVTILSSDITGAATDADGEALQLVSVSNAINGTVSIDAFGNVIFKPNAEFSGQGSFSYQITDGTNTVSGIATVAISAVDDAPRVGVAVTAQTTLEDHPFAFTMPTGAFTDVDTAVLTYSAKLADGSVLPSWLVFDAATQTFLGTPPATFNGILSISIAASDGRSTTTQEFTFEVVPVNNAPVVAQALPDVTIANTDAVNIPLVASSFADIDSEFLSYSASLSDGSVLPAWLDIDPSTGKILGTVPAGFSGVLDIRVTASDGSLTASDVFTLTVTATNVAPVTAMPLSDVSFNEDTAISYAIPAGSFTDVDNAVLSYAATLSDGAALPSWLAFNTATQTFSGTPPANFNGALDVKVIASDGSLTASDVFTLTITPVNDAPVVATLLPDKSSPEDTAVSFTLPASSFTDVDGDALTYSATLSTGAVLPSWLVFNAATQTFTGTPPANFNGSLDVKVTASDGNLTASDVFTLSITPVNDAPVVAALLPDQSSPEDTAVNFALPAGSFSDIDGDALAYTATLANGTTLPNWLVFNAATLTFSGTPPANFNGNIDVKVVASDGSLFASDIFTLAISPVNDAPVVAVPLADVSSPEDIAISFTIPANAFSDVDGDALNLTATLESGAAIPAWLTFDAATCTFSGTPPLNYNGVISVKVTANDGSLTASDVFALNVTPVNDAPVLATPLADQSSPEDTAVSFALPATAFTDVDGDSLSYSATLSNGAAIPAWLTFNAATGSFTGTPPTNFNGSVDVKVTASDGSLTVSDVFTLAITPVNDAPVVAALLADQSSPEDTAVNFTLPVGSFTDVDNAVLTYTATLANGSTLPSWLTFTAATQTFSGTPPANFNGSIDVKITASDGSLTASDVFTLAITPVNDAPVVAALLPDRSSAEDTALSFTLPAGSFTDVDNAVLNYTAVLSNGAALPSWLTFSASTQTFSGTPPVNFNGSLDVKVTASDGSLTASDVFMLTVTPVNDAPILAALLPDITSPEDAAVSLTLPASSFTDVDNAVLSYAATLSNGASLPSWLVFNAATQTFAGTPPANFNGSVDVKVTASDGNLTASDVFTLSITPVNDAPVVATLLPDKPSPEDTAVSFTLPAGSFTDVDNAVLTYSATLATGAVLPSWLTFNAATQTFTGTPPANFNGSLDVKVTASDGSLSASDVFTLTITPVNDAPVASADGSLAVVYNTLLTITAASLLANDTDVDGDTLTIQSVSAASNGTVSLNAAGNVVFTPTAGFSGNASFTYTVSDGHGGTANAQVTLVVAANTGANVINGTAGADLIIGTVSVDSIFAGAGDDIVYGDSSNDTLRGEAGNDILDGGGGADMLIGGTGNDTYVVDNTGDVTTELANEGTDLVISSINWTLVDNIENLTLLNVTDLNGTGNALSNTINGTIGNNILDGGAGADTLIGGLGNDTYIVDNTGDIVTEALNEGTDTILSSVTYVLANNVENLTLTGTSAINGTGNGLDNLIIANAGNNVLNGGAGTDTLSYATAASGVTVSLALTVAQATGGSGSDTLSGFENLIGSAFADTLTGAAGVNTLIGGAGNDTYTVQDTGDIIVELASEGIDTVQSSVTYALAANVESLTLTGSTAINGTGNALDNILTGNTGANTLTGGVGNDTYIIQNTTDVVTELANEGTDAIQSSVTYTLGNNIENLTLTGTSAINGTGNALANIITGNTGVNVLNGGAGNDILVGGAGADTFVFNSLLGTSNVDAISDFSVVDDTINLENTGTGLFTALTATGVLAANALWTGTAAHLATDRIIYDSATGKLYYDADGTGATAQVQFATIGTGLALTNVDFLVI